MAEVPAPDSEVRETERRSAWLSHGLERLVHDKAAPDPHFDVVIVGSGYGGSVAAYELARIEASSRPRVCVLERGSEYLRGSFPSRMADLAGHVRFAGPDNAVARGTLEGLFDVRLGPDVNVLLASGLGGGSLINAGVLEMPRPSVFREPRWPTAIRDDTTLRARARILRKLLGAHRVGGKIRKLAALRSLDRHRFRAVRASVATSTGPNSANSELDACIRCGDCVTGCNHNAKDSLDLNLLRMARDAGTEIYTGASVLRIERDVGGIGWVVFVNHTERHLRERQKEPFRLHAGRVILAAGTLGSSEILMRSRSATLSFSPQLGKKFSANGDTIFVVKDSARRVNDVARETDAPDRRNVGPTITGMLDLRSGDPDTDVVVQDLSVPGPLRAIFEEVTTTTDALNKLLIPDPSRHAPEKPFLDSAAIDEKQTERSLAVAMIGRDSADGVLKRHHDEFVPGGDGVLTVRWPSLRNDLRFAAYHKQLDRLLSASKLQGADSRVLQNPVWRPLSEDLEKVFGAQRGPMLTVHPLGGCPMGDDASEGVVDDCGCVFDPSKELTSKAVHPGLYVLDGSIVPTSLGINPSLTIAVLAHRAMERWRLEDERTTPTTLKPEPVPQRQPRPYFALVQPQRARETEIQVTEQLCGHVHLQERDARSAGEDGHLVELTLTYAPQSLSKLRSANGDDRLLVVRPGVAGRGLLRIHEVKPGIKVDEWTRGDLELEVDVTGTLRIFRHGRSSPPWRAVRALFVWLLHRGWRDVVQNLYDRLRRWLGVLPLPDEREQTARQYIHKLWQLADHAGSIRLFEYELTTGSEARGPKAKTWTGFTDATIVGRKRLRYALGANPWMQLQELTLTSFPRLERWWACATWAGMRAFWSDFSGACRRFFRKPVLALNLDYLVMKSVPLLRVVAQQDRPSALVDLTRFALYLSRVVLQIHAWTFRRPDARTDREPQRLPGGIRDRLPEPEIEWRVVARRPDGTAICSRLARYRNEAAIREKGTQGANPVLLIHGYSASGTTYAHAAVQGNLAETLCTAGRDVWVIDMRSSAGLKSATEPWAFEDMAEQDLPDAIFHILAVTRPTNRKIDVVAHCMGSAMFSMALLGPRDNELSQRIGRVVLSQIGPVMELSTANVFRAYLMRWIRHFLPLSDYSFRPVHKKLGLGGNFLDRILATLPYPRSEFRLENPRWPPGVALPWATSRHRMDALYARTFSLANMSKEALDHIDDFFGPLSIETVSQVIHFADTRTVTDRTGFNRYVRPFRLQSRFTFPVLYLHGRDNGLADAKTLDLMREALESADIPQCPYRHLETRDEVLEAIATRREDLKAGTPSLMTWCIEGHGHQDPLIGKDACRVTSVIATFLEP